MPLISRGEEVRVIGPRGPTHFAVRGITSGRTWRLLNAWNDGDDPNDELRFVFDTNYVVNPTVDFGGPIEDTQP